MSDKMKFDHWMLDQAEQPLNLPDALRRDLAAELRPMERSIAVSVMSAVHNERMHRRSLQSLWLGLSPVMAVLVVVVLYVGGAMWPASMPMQTSGAALRVQNSAPVTDAAPEVMLKSTGSPKVACQPRTPRVLLGGDGLRKQVLVTWLRQKHADTAQELENAAPGQEVSVTLDAGEVRDFVNLIVVNGFSGEGASGLRIVPGYSLASWLSVIDSAALTVCIVP
ncbi:MAG: hypothetical protein ACPL2N_07685 [Candidatus Cryosericum sp.]